MVVEYSLGYQGALSLDKLPTLEEYGADLTDMGDQVLCNQMLMLLSAARGLIDTIIR